MLLRSAIARQLMRVAATLAVIVALAVVVTLVLVHVGGVSGGITTVTTVP